MAITGGILVASGDLRSSANEVCWPAQRAMEAALGRAVAGLGHELVRAHPYKRAQRHGFIGSQHEGMEVFAGIDPQAPLIVAEAVWLQRSVYCRPVEPAT